MDLRGAAPAELRKELAARVRARLAMQIAAGADADPVRLSLPGYRARWYEQRFGASAGAIVSVCLTLSCSDIGIGTAG